MGQGGVFIYLALLRVTSYCKNTLFSVGVYLTSSISLCKRVIEQSDTM